jgi:magnesium transporter
MLRIYFKTLKDGEFVTLTEPREGCWIHVDEATPQDLNEISRLTGLEYTDLQDCLDKYEVPRIERIKHHTLIFTRYPGDQEGGLYTATFTMILTSHYFITIAPHSSLLIKHFLASKHKLSTLQKSKLLIHLLLKIAQEFTTHVKKARHNVLQQEKEMITVDSEDITALTKHEEVLNQYMSTLAPMHTVLEAITSGKYTNLYEKDQELLEDLLNAVKQSEDLCSTVLKSIRSLRDSYQIIFTNNLHKTIKLLTALTIIFSIPTMIASLYGMNIELPLANRTLAFPIILAFIAGLSIIGLLIFRRKRWL